MRDVGQIAYSRRGLPFTWCWFYMDTRRTNGVERSLAPGNSYVEVVEAAFGPDAGMVGAALMARDGMRDLQAV